jgi:hypothetical protein
MLAYEISVLVCHLRRPLASDDAGPVPRRSRDRSHSSGAHGGSGDRTGGRRPVHERLGRNLASCRHVTAFQCPLHATPVLYPRQWLMLMGKR